VPPPIVGKVCEGIQSKKKPIGRPEREIVVLKYGYYNYQNRHTWLPKSGLSHRPQLHVPYLGRQGYMVTSAYAAEVEVGADGYPSEPPSGAAAATQPARAVLP
jgi:hypothetical protein